MRWLLLLPFLACASPNEPENCPVDRAVLSDGILTVTVYDQACRPYRCFYRIGFGTTEDNFTAYCRLENEI